jgi:hypothetical protein
VSSARLKRGAGMWVSFSRQEQKAAITAGQPAKGCEMIV